MVNQHRRNMRKVIAWVCVVILFIIGILSLVLPTETFAFFLRVIFVLICSIIASYIVTKSVEFIGFRKSKGYSFYLGKFATKRFTTFFSVFTFVLTVIFGILLETVFNNGGALSQWFVTTSINYRDSDAYLYVGWISIGLGFIITSLILIFSDQSTSE